MTKLRVVAVLLGGLLLGACGGGARERAPAETGETEVPRGEQSPFTVDELPGVPAGVRAELDEISRRGRELAAYHRAAAAATDALSATNPETYRFDSFVAVAHPPGWRVRFGELPPEWDRYEVAYTVECLGAECRIVEPGPPDPALLPLARAVHTAAEAIEGKEPRYDPAVFREPDGFISVYLTPGSEDPGQILFGGDFHVQVSADGTRAEAVTPLHLDVHDLLASVPPGATPMGTMITNVLTDRPSVTDVMLVLLHPAAGPRLIICQSWIFRIDRDGSITVVAKRE